MHHRTLCYNLRLVATETIQGLANQLSTQETGRMDRLNDVWECLDRLKNLTTVQEG